jgi:molecular chaperone GrpE
MMDTLYSMWVFDSLAFLRLAKRLMATLVFVLEEFSLYTSIPIVMFRRASLSIPQLLSAVQPSRAAAMHTLRQQQVSISKVAPVSVNTNFIRGFSTDGKETTPDTEESAKVDEEEDLDDAGVKTVEEVTAEFEGKLKEMKTNVLRAYADEENVRRIAKRDVENARVYANTKFAKSLLDVADNLERALDAAAKCEIALTKDCETSKAFHNLVEGVEMTQNQLNKVFNSHGVVKYGAVDDVFDPEIHDALFKMPDPSKTDGTVGAILKPGYRLNDRVIRAAEVGTIVNDD